MNTLLEGVAARSIQGLSLTADNYNSAVEILHKRFGGNQQIVTSHMDELLKLPLPPQMIAPHRFDISMTKLAYIFVDWHRWAYQRTNMGAY